MFKFNKLKIYFKKFSSLSLLLLSGLCALNFSVKTNTLAADSSPVLTEESTFETVFNQSMQQARNSSDAKNNVKMTKLINWLDSWFNSLFDKNRRIADLKLQDLFKKDGLDLNNPDKMFDAVFDFYKPLFDEIVNNVSCSVNLLNKTSGNENVTELTDQLYLVKMGERDNKDLLAFNICLFPDGTNKQTYDNIKGKLQNQNVFQDLNNMSLPYNIKATDLATNAEINDVTMLVPVDYSSVLQYIDSFDSSFSQTALNDDKQQLKTLYPNLNIDDSTVENKLRNCIYLFGFATVDRGALDAGKGINLQLTHENEEIGKFEIKQLAPYNKFSQERFNQLVALFKDGFIRAFNSAKSKVQQ